MNKPTIRVIGMESCPFCGSNHTTIISDNIWGTWPHVICLDCGMIGPKTRHDRASVRLWNQRKSPRNKRATRFLRCPFCGSVARIFNVNGNGYWFRENIRIECANKRRDDCGHTDYFDSIEGAVAAWHRRAAIQKPKGE